MKKTLIIIGIVLVVLIGLLAVIPLFFKQTLIDKTKTAINRNVNATVEFADLKLSLLRNFPNLTAELTHVSVTGIDEFRQDTLLSAPSLRTKMSIMQLFKKETMRVEEIILDRPQLKLVVGKTGNVNWDIAKESTTATEESESEDLDLNLDKIEIMGAGFIYDDREIDMLLHMTGIDVSISGEMYGTSAELQADGKIDRFNLVYEGSNYISNVSLETSTLLEIDYEKMDITIRENELLVNRLPLEVTGLIQMPSDTMYFDLALKTKESGFGNFLALIPPDYEHYLEGFQTSGTASIAGSVKGFYFDEEYPAFQLKIDVADGSLHYTELPEEIRIISADITIVKPQGVLDSTRVDISRAHAEVKNSPVDLSLRLRNLVSDPYFDGAFKGKVNLNELKDALPLDSVNMSGVIDANLLVRGRYSAIENEDYSNIQSDGTVLLSGFVFESANLTQQVVIPNGQLDFSPKAISLKGLNMKVGQSDFMLTGQVTNYLNYIFKEGVLAGNMQLNSSLVNMNELMRLATDEAPATDSPDEAVAFSIPKNVDFTFNSNIRQVVFERVPITNVRGLITARDEKLVLDNLNMETLGGEVNMTGSYQNTAENQPLFDFGFNVKKVDIPQAFQTISGLQKIFPIAGNSQGKLSSDLKMRGQLDSQFNLIPPTVNGSGRLTTEGVQIKDSPLFSQLKGILKAERLKDVKVDDFRAKIEIKNGAVFLDPFKTRIAGQQATLAGSLNIEKILAMRMDFNLEREAFGPDIQNILNVLPGQERIQNIPAAVVLNGPVNKPDVSIDLEDTRKYLVEEVKKSSKEELQKSINKLGEGLKNILK